MKFLEDVRKVHLLSNEELAAFEAVTDVRNRFNDMALCGLVENAKHGRIVKSGIFIGLHLWLSTLMQTFYPDEYKLTAPKNAQACAYGERMHEPYDGFTPYEVWPCLLDVFGIRKEIPRLAQELKQPLTLDFAIQLTPSLVEKILASRKVDSPTED